MVILLIRVPPYFFQASSSIQGNGPQTPLQHITEALVGLLQDTHAEAKQECYFPSTPLKEQCSGNLVRLDLFGPGV